MENKTKTIIALSVAAILATLYAVKNKFPLKKGSMGARVLRMQRALNIMGPSHNIDPVSERGVFDTETEQALYLMLDRKQLGKSEYKALVSAADKYDETGVYDLTQLY
jgi:hypothetical protein